MNEIMLASEALDCVLGKYKFNTVLDIGSGQGLHAEVFRRNGKTVVTIDAGNHWGIADIQADFVGHVFDEPFDLVWCSHVLEHQVNVQMFLQAAYRALKPGGILAITVPPAKSTIVGGHVSIWNAGLLFYNLILAGFDCAGAMAKHYGYNISVVVRKSFAVLPPLHMDAGDIERMSHLFPNDIGAKQDFEGNLEEVAWTLEQDTRPVCGPAYDAHRLDLAKFHQLACPFGSDWENLLWTLVCIEGPGAILAFGPDNHRLLAAIAPRQRLRPMYSFDRVADVATAHPSPVTPQLEPETAASDARTPRSLNGIECIPGLVENTLPMWLQRTRDIPIAMILIFADPDLEGAGVLRQLDTRILPGTVLFFDQLGDWPKRPCASGWQDGSWQALSAWMYHCRREVRILSRGPMNSGSVVVKL